MNQELAMMHSLRKVLESTSQGRGVAQSLAKELSRGEDGARSVARLTLLGYPLEVSLRGLTAGASEEVSMLASLVVWSSKGSARLVGERGKSLSSVLERWVKLKESAKMEYRVHAYRGLVAVVVLGALTSLISSLAPLLGAFDLAGKTPEQPGYLTIGAAAMAAMSSATLGVYVSGRGFVVYALASLAAFGLVSVAMGPLVAIPTISLWGIK